MNTSGISKNKVVAILGLIIISVMIGLTYRDNQLAALKKAELEQIIQQRETQAANATQTEEAAQAANAAATAQKLLDLRATEEAVKKEQVEEIKKEVFMLEESIKEKISGIVCWGDSLTAGDGGNGVTFPAVLETLIGENIYPISVANLGVAGETSRTIVGRAGTIPFVVGAFTIPSDTKAVEVKLSSSDGLQVEPLVQGDGGLNNVYINGIEGTLSIVRKDSKNTAARYFFRRTTAGQEVRVKKGTVVITNASQLYKEYIPVIFIGQNGGWVDANDLISQQMSIVNAQTSNRDRYVILGLPSGTARSNADLERAMVEQYGDKYINLREYLSTNGLQDAGLSPTEEDKKQMQAGSVPASLRADSIHLNSYGYTLVGNIVYQRMVQLGYFDEVITIKDEMNLLKEKLKQ